MECTNEEVVETRMAVASGKMNFEDLLSWVKDHDPHLHLNFI